MIRIALVPDTATVYRSAAVCLLNGSGGKRLRECDRLLGTNAKISQNLLRYQADLCIEFISHGENAIGRDIRETEHRPQFLHCGVVTAPVLVKLPVSNVHLNFAGCYLF